MGNPECGVLSKRYKFGEYLPVAAAAVVDEGRGFVWLAGRWPCWEW